MNNKDWLAGQEYCFGSLVKGAARYAVNKEMLFLKVSGVKKWVEMPGPRGPRPRHALRATGILALLAMERAPRGTGQARDPRPRHERREQWRVARRTATRPRWMAEWAAWRPQV